MCLRSGAEGAFTVHTDQFIGEAFGCWHNPAIGMVFGGLIDNLYRLPYLHGDNGIVQPLMECPFGFRLDDFGTVLVGARTTVIHPQSSTIKLIMKYMLYHGISPELFYFVGIFSVHLIPVQARGRDALLNESGHDLPVGHTAPLLRSRGPGGKGL